MLILGDGHPPDSKLEEDMVSCVSWNDVLCPICLDVPHNCVLLQCSSYGTGCRPFICGTDHLHSNCLERLKEANGKSSGSQSPSSVESVHFVDPKPNGLLLCPLCRGEVTGWVVIDKARVHLDVRNRTCEEEKCRFSGNYFDLQKHAQVEHPHACPSKIDPARQLDWDNFQQSSEIIDVLGTIHSEVPNGIVLGDYVIDYGVTTPEMILIAFKIEWGNGGHLAYFVGHSGILGNQGTGEEESEMLQEETISRKIVTSQNMEVIRLAFFYRVSLWFFVMTSRMHDDAGWLESGYIQNK